MPLTPSPTSPRAVLLQLFQAMGSGQQQALLTHVIIGVVNVVTTLVAVFTVDR